MAPAFLGLSGTAEGVTFDISIASDATAFLTGLRAVHGFLYSNELVVIVPIKPEQVKPGV